LFAGILALLALCYPNCIWKK